jgi:galactokinase
MNKTYTEKAHGRVNLIGEHTDYNGGWVLPTTITQFTEVTLDTREDDMISVASSPDKKGTDRFLSYRLGEERRTSTWIDYLQGSTKLLRELMEKKGEKNIWGMSIKIRSTIPEGSGLSSSAALTVSFLKVMRTAFDLHLTDVELALLAQRVENEFVGAHVGIMDQMAVSLARSGEALFLDTKMLSFQQLKLPLHKTDVLIINSGISHRFAEGGGYNERRAQCEEACKILGIKELRDISIEEMNKKNLPDLLARRSKHVITENARVWEAVECLKTEDMEKLGKLFGLSHASMRDDYEVSIPEIDLLVKLCENDSEVYGARLTGGGFGGSIVAITKKGSAARIGKKVIEEYHRLTGQTATVLS